MSETRHTPGEWTPVIDWTHEIMGQQPLSEIWAGEHQVCKLCAPPPHMHTIETYAANARLIAAAPALLEALENAIAEMERVRKEFAQKTEESAHLFPCILQARAALARAKGNE